MHIRAFLISAHGRRLRHTFINPFLTLSLMAGIYDFPCVVLIQVFLNKGAGEMALYFNFLSSKWRVGVCRSHTFKRITF